MNEMGCSNPFAFFYRSTTAMVSSDANENVMKSREKYGLLRIGASAKDSLMDAKEYLSFVSHFIS